MSIGVPGLDNKRMQIKAPVNPLDKTTLVSIFPKHIPPEVKHTIQPGSFQIPYGTFAEPGFLVVGPSSWWKETDEGQPMLEIPHSSIQIAHSIVRDWMVGILACDMGESRPGLFYMPGLIDKKDPEYLAMLEQANKRQKNWFQALVKIADVLWARTNGNPICVSDDMKLAARELSLEKPWTKDFQNFQMVNCKACGALKNPQYPVCPSCKAIDNPELAAKLGIKFAQ
jgi:hypothetical protein